MFQREATVGDCFSEPITDRAIETRSVGLATNKMEATATLREHGVVPSALLQPFISFGKKACAKYRFKRADHG